MLLRRWKFRPAFRIYTLTAAAVVLAGLFAWLQFNNWSRAYDAANESLVVASRAISIHIDDLASIATQQLKIVAAEIESAPDANTGAALAIEKMHALVGATTVLRSLAYVDADGRLIDSTFAKSPGTLSVAHREYFQFHKSDPYDQPRFGLAARSQKNGQWFLPLTQRINNRDGSFAGVLIATIAMSHFVAIFDTFHFGSEAPFALIRNDGNILLRTPLRDDDFGLNIASSPLFAAMNTVRNGNYEYTSPFDKVRRVSGYYSSPQTGVTVLVARSRASVFKGWISFSIYPTIWFVLVYIGTIFVAIRWIRQMQLREEGERRLALREAELSVIAENSTDVIERINRAGLRHYVSSAAARIYERRAEDLVGSNIFDSLEQQAMDAWTQAFAKLAAGSVSETVRFERVRSDGTRTWLESALSCVMAAGARLPDTYVVITRDVTKEELAKRELNLLATTDDLTGLLNKRVFGLQLKRRFAEMKKAGRPISVALLDLDRFKLYNDTYGHVAGDKCLRGIARVVREMLAGETAIAARFGGEELVILFPAYEEAAVASILEAIREAVEALAIPHEHNEPSCRVTVSIGYATVSSDNRPAVEQLMIAADSALYAAKSAGRNALRRFDDSTDHLAASADSGIRMAR